MIGQLADLGVGKLTPAQLRCASRSWFAWHCRRSCAPRCRVSASAFDHLEQQSPTWVIKNSKAQKRQHHPLLSPSSLLGSKGRKVLLADRLLTTAAATMLFKVQLVAPCRPVFRFHWQQLLLHKGFFPRCARTLKTTNVVLFSVP